MSTPLFPIPLADDAKSTSKHSNHANSIYECQIVEDEEVEAGVTASECFTAALAEAVYAHAGQSAFQQLRIQFQLHTLRFPTANTLGCEIEDDFLS